MRRAVLEHGGTVTEAFWSTASSMAFSRAATTCVRSLNTALCEMARSLTFFSLKSPRLTLEQSSRAAKSFTIDNADAYTESCSLLRASRWKAKSVRASLPESCSICCLPNRASSHPTPQCSKGIVETNSADGRTKSRTTTPFKRPVKLMGYARWVDFSALEGPAMNGVL